MEPPPKKRAREQQGPKPSSGRRALSCTECKRRKTKCSALGQTPCDACVKRGKPEDCVWEDAPQQLFALATDLDALRQEVADLRGLINSRSTVSAQHDTALVSPSLQHPPRPASASSFDQRALSTGAASSSVPPVTAFASPVSSTHHPSVGRVEYTVSDLEAAAIGPAPGARNVFDSSPANGYCTTGLGMGLKPSPSFDNVADLMPHTDGGTILINEYFGGPLHKGWYIVEEGTFKQLHQLYKVHGLQPGTNHCWLALYFMIAALTTKLTDKAAYLFPNYSAEQLSRIPNALYQASVDALESANYMAVPQIRHIQVALLYVLFLVHFGETPDQSNVALRHIDLAVSTALWLELDCLGDDPSVLPTDDPALAGLSPKAQLELCKRLIHFLAFLDTTIQKRPGIWRLGGVVTPLPGNYVDLTRVDETPRPSYELTTASLPRAVSSFANVIRQYHAAGELPYEILVLYDQALRQVLDEMPHANAPLESAWMIHIIRASIHNRLVRLHRPHLLKGYEEPDSDLSRVVAVNSARSIVNGLILFNTNTRIRPNFVKRWILGACVVLAIDYVFGNPDSRTSLLQALDIFGAVNPYDRAPATTLKCKETVEAFLAAGDARVGQSAPSEDAMAAFFDDVKQRLEYAPPIVGLVDFGFAAPLPFDIDSMLNGLWSS